MLVLVWRVVANVIGGRDSRSDMTSIGIKRMRHLYIKNECLKYGRLVLFGQLDIHKVSFGIKW